MNDQVRESIVEVDPEQLAREAEAIELPAADAAPPDAPAPPAPEPAAAPAASWSSVTPGIVEALDLAVCPNWQLSGDEKSAFSEALAPALDQLFPGGLGDERWAPYFRLLAVTVAIAAPRFDREAFRFKPLRKAKPQEPAEPGAPAAAGAAAPGGGSFSVGAGQ